MDEVPSLQAAQQGSVDAFNEIILTYQDAIYNHACWLLQDSDLAQDIAQHTFLQAFLNLSKYRGGSFRAWLMRIATNACLDELRRQKRHPGVPLEPPDDDTSEQEAASWMADTDPLVEDRVEQIENREEILEALACLKIEYRAAILLVDVQAFNYAEAAAALSIPVGTVKSRVARGRLQLRERLRKGPGEKSRAHDVRPAD